VTAQEEVEEAAHAESGRQGEQHLDARTVRYYTTLGLVDRPTGYEGGVAVMESAICCSCWPSRRSSPVFASP